jgi:hypothetical protein
MVSSTSYVRKIDFESFINNKRTLYFGLAPVIQARARQILGVHRLIHVLCQIPMALQNSLHLARVEPKILNRSTLPSLNSFLLGQLHGVDHIER